MRQAKRLFKVSSIAIAAAMLAACSTNGGSDIPNTSQAPLASNVLQVAVGTANIGQDGAVGLNVVSTLRGTNGLSGVLASLPTLTGPAGFTVPAGVKGAYSSAHGANPDIGTNHITGSPQVPLNNAGLVQSTLGTFTGIFANGFGPLNSDASVVNGGYYPGNPNASGGNGFKSSQYDTLASSQITALLGGGSNAFQPYPFFSTDPMVYLNGPPAVPFFNNGTFPPSFAGYSPGIAVFETAPVAGTYTLAAAVNPVNASPVTYTASASLASTAVLGAIPMPTFVSDGTGGGSGVVVIPAGVTETMVFIVDVNGNSGAQTFFSVPVAGTGAQTYTLGDHLGPCNGSGCQTAAATQQPTMNSGDFYYVSAIGFDYPAFEASPPGNIAPKPTIVGANGQADITMSPVLLGQLP